jgi:hypothetical protein
MMLFRDRPKETRPREPINRAQLAANLRVARADLVRRYRAQPHLWPDGIDSETDRWYRPEEWPDADS